MFKLHRLQAQQPDAQLFHLFILFRRLSDSKTLRVASAMATFGEHRLGDIVDPSLKKSFKAEAGDLWELLYLQKSWRETCFQDRSFLLQTLLLAMSVIIIPNQSSPYHFHIPKGHHCSQPDTQ